MTDRNNRVGFNGVTLLTSAGFLSGLLTIAVSYTHDRFPAQFLLGAPFGVLISGCLVGLGILCDSWRVIRLILVATVAYFVSFFAAFFFQGIVLTNILKYSEQGTISSFALFVGGIVGAFLLIGEVVFLPRIQPKPRALKLALLWSLLGGALAAGGAALGPSLGAFLLRFVHSLGLASLTNSPFDVTEGAEQTRLLFSLYLVWQSGMGFVLGLLLDCYEQPSVGKEVTTS